VEKNEYTTVCGVSKDKTPTYAVCDNIEQSDDVPRYRKKAASKGLKRSNHKHQYEPCLLEFDKPPNPYTGKSEGTITIFRSYCILCGKVGAPDLQRWFLSPTKNYLWPTGFTDEAKLQLCPETRTIRLFRVKDGYFTKYVPISDDVK